MVRLHRSVRHRHSLPAGTSRAVYFINRTINRTIICSEPFLHEHMAIVGGGRGRRVGAPIVRLEIAQNAVDQAEAVTDDMVGKGRPDRPVPWFWSDRHGAKPLIAGLSRGHTQVITRRRVAGEAYWYLKGERLIAAGAINDERSFMTARRLLSAKPEISARSLVDSDFDLRTLLA
jgi:hypothetical protein